MVCVRRVHTVSRVDCNGEKHGRTLTGMRNLKNLNSAQKNMPRYLLHMVFITTIKLQPGGLYF